jgi:hypothetical protein
MDQPSWHTVDHELWQRLDVLPAKAPEPANFLEVPNGFHRG